MKLLAPTIFAPFPEVVAGMSLKDKTADGGFSMAENGTDSTTARRNREIFCSELGFTLSRLAQPKQNHSAIIHLVIDEYHQHEGDAVLTEQTGWLLGVTIADCVPILLYDPETGSYGAVHSGWRGSSQNIAGLSIAKLTREYGAKPSNLYAWIGPAAGKNSYDVGYDVVSQFNPKYSQISGESKWLFDNQSVVRDQLLDAGLLEEHLEISSLDTITNPELHSDRRDGDKSGRMLAAIGTVKPL